MRCAVRQRLTFRALRERTEQRQPVRPNARKPFMHACMHVYRITINVSILSLVNSDTMIAF